MKIYSALFASILAISSAATLIRLADTHPITVAAYRMFIAAVILWLVVPSKKLKNIPKGSLKYLILSGIFLAMHFGLWISSLEHTSVASSLVLVTMNPIFVGLGSFFILKEKLSISLVTGTILSVLGCIVLIGGEASVIEGSLRGNILAVGGALAMSSYMLTGRKMRSAIDNFVYITYVYSFAAIFLLLFAVCFSVSLVHLNTHNLMWIIAIAIIPQLIGHSLINWSLAYLQTSYLALAILLEPVVGTIIAYIVLGENISMWTCMGGSLVISGVASAFYPYLKH